MDNPVVHADGQGRHGKQKKSKLKTVVAIAIAVVALLILLFGGWLALRSATAANIDDDTYQAVFLTNGQVYFGKLDMAGGDEYARLTDIFYLQAASAEGGAENPQETTSQDASDVQLIKLGTEIHGPQDEMMISKEHILFFENLKDDGKVATSIGEYQGQQQNSQPATLQDETVE